MITGALYGTHFKVFCDSMRAAATQIGKTIYIGALLYPSAPAGYDVPATQNWNAGVLQMQALPHDYFIIHDYFTAYATNSSISDILSTGKTVPTADMAYVKSQLSGAGLAIKPIAFTEWNIQATGSKQNVSYIAGIHAAKTLGTIIKNQFGQASRWDWPTDGAMATIWDYLIWVMKREQRCGTHAQPFFTYTIFKNSLEIEWFFDSLKASNTDLTTFSSTFSSGQPATVIVNSGVNQSYSGNRLSAFSGWQQILLVHTFRWYR
ncbi:MAG: hypothetical protein WDM90_21940 [Ferruginibacter sp.]